MKIAFLIHPNTLLCIWSFKQESLYLTNLWRKKSEQRILSGKEQVISKKWGEACNFSQSFKNTTQPIPQSFLSKNNFILSRFFTIFKLASEEALRIPT